MGNPISRDEFLQRAQARFGDRYDYSPIVYKSYKTPIKIRCRDHPVKEITITRNSSFSPRVVASSAYTRCASACSNANSVEAVPSIPRSCSPNRCWTSTDA
jgi:hypothetical protein